MNIRNFHQKNSFPDKNHSINITFSKKAKHKSQYAVNTERNIKKSK